MIKIEIKEKIFLTKKAMVIIAISLVVVAIIVLISLYISQKTIRNWVDEHFLNKSITEEDISTISLNIDKTNQVYVFSKYVALLNDKKITLYNSYGEEITNIEVGINTAVFDSNDKYLAIAEDGGTEFCLILDKTYLWSSNVDGKILQVHVNKNGYVALITEDSTHKSIVTVYDSLGKQLFKSYFSSTRIIDASISKDNKYIVIGELDSSGSIIQSNIKVISIENAQNDTDNAIIYTYNAEGGKLLISLKYQDKNQIVCMYEDSISVIKDQESTNILELNSADITYMSVNFNNYIVYIREEKENLLKTNSTIEFINTSNNQKTSNTLDDIAKQIVVQDNILAVNVGTELYFFNPTGWMLKKYTATQEITNIKFSENLAAVVYKDKISIIDL